MGEKFKKIPLADVGAGTRLLFDHCIPLELRCLWFYDSIKLKQVWSLDSLGYGVLGCALLSFTIIRNHKHVQWEDGRNTAGAVYWAEMKG